jgi:hypothetical protein
MKAMVTVQIGTRQVMEVREDVPETRQAWRELMSDLCCRIEIATFGPPGPVEEMTLEDRPFSFEPKNA